MQMGRPGKLVFQRRSIPNMEIEADKGTERKGLLGATRRKQGNGIDS